ncbi:MAG: TetR/AcrR family transcriptional regulator [Treponemataceae bacterium]|nr:TetR/AcrR family transcriptional regulator [Treponemataceae bacterium]
MTKKNPNITSAKYEQWIIEAFIELLKTNTYEQITIQQITDEARISRQTFYRHFESKDDILELFSNNLTDQLSKQLNSITEKNIYNIFLCYFSFWLQNTDLLSLVKTAGGEYFLGRYYNRTMHNILNILKEFLPEYSDQDFDLIKAFLLGGLYQIKLRWLENGYKESPAQLARLIADLFNSRSSKQ